MLYDVIFQAFDRESSMILKVGHLLFCFFPQVQLQNTFFSKLLFNEGM